MRWLLFWPRSEGIFGDPEQLFPSFHRQGGSPLSKAYVGRSPMPGLATGALTGTRRPAIFPLVGIRDRSGSAGNSAPFPETGMTGGLWQLLLAVLARLSSREFVQEPVNHSHTRSNGLVEQFRVRRTGVWTGGCQFLSLLHPFAHVDESFARDVST